MYVIKNNSGYNQNFSPTGTFQRKLNKKQIDFLYRWNQGTVEITNGHWWIPKYKNEYPLKETMESLYAEKTKIDNNPMKKDAIKRIPNGVYGKFLEKRTARNDSGDIIKVPGDRFNSVYAAEIEIGDKIEVAEFILRNKLQPIHIAVDGVVSVNNCNEEETMEMKFGGWRLSNENKCISIGTGVIAIKDKINKEVAKDFSLDYDWLLNQIQQNPDSQEYKMMKKSPVTLAIACKDGGGRWKELGKLQTITKSINIGGEDKRCYKKLPKTGREVLEGDIDSSPWDVSIIRGNN
jgi:hypothetical protein